MQPIRISVQAFIAFSDVLKVDAYSMSHVLLTHNMIICCRLGKVHIRYMHDEESCVNVYLFICFVVLIWLLSCEDIQEAEATD